MSWIKVHFWQSLIISASLCMLFLSYHFALERIISADTADYLVHLINGQTFYYGSQRFIAASTQLPPLLLIKLHVPFNLVLEGYSVSLMFFHVAIIGVLLFYFREKSLALVILLAHVLGGSFLFYYPISEYQMGLSLSILFYAFLKKNHSKLFSNWKVAFVTLALGITIIYSHPLTIIFVSFLIIYLFLEQAYAFNWQKLGLVFFFSALIFASKYLLFDVINDTQTISSLQSNFSLAWNGLQIFWQELLTYHYLFLLLFLLTISYLISVKKYKLLLLLVVYFLANLFSCSLKQGHEPFTWYAAHIYQVIFYLPIFVLMNQWENGHSWLVKAATTVVLFIGMYQLVDRHRFNSDRIERINNFLLQAKEMKASKVIVDGRDQLNTVKN